MRGRDGSTPVRSHGSGRACYDERRPEKCEACRAAQRAYALSTREHKKAYRAANLKHINATARAYRESHREQRRAYSATQRDKANARAKAYRLSWTEETRALRRAVNRAWRLRAIYGLADGEYDQMLASQGGGCAICGKPPVKRALHVDHEHVRGWSRMPPARRREYVRGLLCYLCNRLLARGITASVLRGAAVYLENYASRSLKAVGDDRPAA